MQSCGGNIYSMTKKMICSCLRNFPSPESANVSLSGDSVKKTRDKLNTKYKLHWL